MSRARNRADGDFGDLDITNIGAVSLDSIKGDADGNTSLAFSGSDVITITTGGSTAATFNASQALTLSGNLLIPNAGTIGSAGDTNAISISSGGVVAVTATTANTNASDGALTVAGGVGIAADLSVGDDLRLISDSAVLSFGADSDTTLTHTDGTGLTLNSTNKLTFGDAASFIHQSSDGVMTIDGEATIDLNASTAVLVSNDLKLNSDAAVLGFGADNEITLTHVADTGLLLNGTSQLQFNDGSQFINAPSATVLDVNATDEIELNATLVDVNANLDVSGTYTGAGLMTTGGNIVIPDAGTIGSASDTNAIGISSGGVVSVTATTANTSASDGALTVAGGLGVAADASVGDDLRLISDAAVLSFGADGDVTLTHVADTGLLLNGTSQLQFNDASQNITAPSATVLDINATDEIELNATLIDINGNVEISGTTAQVGVSTSTAKDIFNAGMSVKNGSTSAGFVEFFEDSDNGTNKVTLVGPASTADVTVVLPTAAGTVATTDDATALAIALG